jgi:hypothetical protein
MQQVIEQTNPLQRMANFVHADIRAPEAKIVHHAALDDFIAAQEHHALAQGLQIPTAQIEASHA